MTLKELILAVQDMNLTNDCHLTVDGFTVTGAEYDIDNASVNLVVDDFDEYEGEDEDEEDEDEEDDE